MISTNGKEIYYFDSIGDVSSEMICPNCKAKIYLPNWGELQVVYRRIKNASNSRIA